MTTPFQQFCSNRTLLANSTDPGSKYFCASPQKLCSPSRAQMAPLATRGRQPQLSILKQDNPSTLLPTEHKTAGANRSIRSIRGTLQLQKVSHACNERERRRRQEEAPALVLPTTRRGWNRRSQPSRTLCQ